MNILITGAKGFIGQNLIAHLKENSIYHLLPYDQDSTQEELDTYTKLADVVVHLAGVNRPEDPKDFMDGNFGFTSTLIQHLAKHHNQAPIILSSSIQATLNNPYGISKKAGENLLIQYGHDHDVKIYIYRFPNVFGKWCRPNYNSVVATFCYNIAHGLPITISNPENELHLVYIDDVISVIVELIEKGSSEIFQSVHPIHPVKLGILADLIQSFRASRSARSIPKTDDPLTKKLYSTYLTYLPIDEFKYPLKMNIDHRGSFTEVIKTLDRGQISINISKPGITKGNHWHHTKNEKFLVVYGKGIIRFRHVITQEVIEYPVSGELLEVVDIPPGYTHNIENIGDTDMVTLMWVNEIFDPSHPDTIFLEV